MTIETFLAILFFAVTVISYAISRLTTNRLKYVNQKAKTGGETDYVIVLYI